VSAIRPTIAAFLLLAAALTPLTAADKEAAPAPLTPDTTVEGLYKSVIQFHDVFPEELSSIRGPDADRLAASTEQIIVACEKYLIQSSGKPREEIGTVEYISARFLHSISERKREEFLRRKQAGQLQGGPENQNEFMMLFFKDVKTRALSAREKLPVEHRYSPKLDRLLGDVCFFRQEHAEAKKHYKLFLERYPDHAAADMMELALAKTHLELMEYDEGIEVCEKAMKKYYKSRSYPYFNEVRWKLFHGKGDLDGMLRSIETAETAFPLKLSNISLAQAERDFYELLLDFQGFRRGYTLFAKGDFKGAREAFEKHVRAIEAKAGATPVKPGGTSGLNPAASVYKSRSDANLMFLEHCAGLPPPVDFELGQSWATPKKVLLRESRGKAVAIVFRALGDVRAGPFLGQLAQFCHSRPDMEIVTIAYLKQGTSPDQQKDELLEDLAKYGYDGAAGFDPDVDGRTIFGRFKVKVGSATLVVANKRGELVWFQEDPKASDVRFAMILLQKIASQP